MDMVLRKCKEMGLEVRNARNLSSADRNSTSGFYIGHLREAAARPPRAEPCRQGPPPAGRGGNAVKLGIPQTSLTQLAIITGARGHGRCARVLRHLLRALHRGRLPYHQQGHDGRLLRKYRALLLLTKVYPQPLTTAGGSSCILVEGHEDLPRQAP